MRFRLVTGLALGAIAAAFVGGMRPPESRAANNDLFANAIDISVSPYAFSGNTNSFDVAGTDPDVECGSVEYPPQNDSAWWRLRPASNGTLAADTSGSNYDTVLAIFERVGNAFVAVPGACNDDSQGRTSRLADIALSAGKTYYLEVTAWGETEGGDLELHVSFAAVAPHIDSIAPATVVAGSGAQSLTITGTNFAPGATVAFGSSTIVPSAVLATQVTVPLAASDVAAGAAIQVRVVHTGLGAAESNAVTFTITNPAPVLTMVSPAIVDRGPGAIEVTLTGNGFTLGTVGRWNGQPRGTSFDSPTSVRMTLTPADLATLGPGAITAFSPAPGGGASDSQSVLIRSRADVNCDQSVTLADVTHVLAVIAQAGAPIPGCGVNPDATAGAPDTADALFVLRVLAAAEPMP